MTRRERLLATLRGEPVDRLAFNFDEINGLESTSSGDPFNIYSELAGERVLTHDLENLPTQAFEKKVRQAKGRAGWAWIRADAVRVSLWPQTVSTRIGQLRGHGALRGGMLMK